MVRYCCNYSHNKIKVGLIKNACRYHKREFQEYNYKELAPFKFCLDAFYVIYPYCLALVYGAKFNSGDSVKIKCPNSRDFIMMEIKSQKVLPEFIIFLKEKLIKFLQSLNFPLELPHQKIKIKVIYNNSCPANYNIGDEFEFNIWRKNELCPAGFSALFPFLSKGGWEKVHCPDPRGIIYNVES